MPLQSKPNQAVNRTPGIIAARFRGNTVVGAGYRSRYVTRATP